MQDKHLIISFDCTGICPKMSELMMCVISNFILNVSGNIVLVIVPQRQFQFLFSLQAFNLLVNYSLQDIWYIQVP